MGLAAARGQQRPNASGCAASLSAGGGRSLLPHALRRARCRASAPGHQLVCGDGGGGDGGGGDGGGGEGGGEGGGGDGGGGEGGGGEGGEGACAAAAAAASGPGEADAGSRAPDAVRDDPALAAAGVAGRRQRCLRAAVNAQTHNGGAALSFASKSGHKGAIRMLLEAGQWRTWLTSLGVLHWRKLAGRGARA